MIRIKEDDIMDMGVGEEMEGIWGKSRSDVDAGFMHEIGEKEIDRHKETERQRI